MYYKHVPFISDLCEWSLSFFISNIFIPCSWGDICFWWCLLRCLNILLEVLANPRFIIPIWIDFICETQCNSKKTMVYTFKTRNKGFWVHLKLIDFEMFIRASCSSSYLGWALLLIFLFCKCETLEARHLYRKGRCHCHCKLSYLHAGLSSVHTDKSLHNFSCQLKNLHNSLTK